MLASAYVNDIHFFTDMIISFLEMLNYIYFLILIKSLLQKSQILFIFVTIVL